MARSRSRFGTPMRAGGLVMIVILPGGLQMASMNDKLGWIWRLLHPSCWACRQIGKGQQCASSRVV